MTNVNHRNMVQRVIKVNQGSTKPGIIFASTHRPLEAARTLGELDLLDTPIFILVPGENAISEAYPPLRNLVGRARVTALPVAERCFANPFSPNPNHAAGIGNLVDNYNAARMFARYLGEERYAVTNGDVRRYDKRILGQQATALDRTAIVGADSLFGDESTNSIPDNSIIGHIARSVGFRQEVFPGGQASAFVSRPGFAVAPNIRVYGEDWLVRLHLASTQERGKKFLATNAIQHDAILRPNKFSRLAADQELGEFVSEGWMYFIEGGDPELRFYPAAWQEFKNFRLDFLKELETRLERSGRQNSQLAIRVETARECVAHACSAIKVFNPATIAAGMRKYEHQAEQWTELLDSNQPLFEVEFLGPPTAKVRRMQCDLAWSPQVVAISGPWRQRIR